MNMPRAFAFNAIAIMHHTAVLFVVFSECTMRVTDSESQFLLGDTFGTLSDMMRHFILLPVLDVDVSSVVLALIDDF